ncbi:Beta-barrel assembly-enhancing protease (plasmid) [Pseudoseohaeicola sp. NH-UV-7]|uniref:tetratricopeptide repeat protein n=1 Tax=Sulfitobacter sp. TBRI5 TaxID=2989732 RepID=UPI003A5E1C05
MPRFTMFVLCLSATFSIALFVKAPDARTLDPLTDFDASGQIIDRQAVKTVSLLKVLQDYGDFRAVLKYFDAELHTSAVLQSVRAAAFAAAGDPVQARTLLDSMTEQRYSEWSMIAEALIARQAGDLLSAESAISKVLSQAPDNAYAHNVAGTIAAVRSEWDAAIEHFSQAVQLAPDGAIYLANLGGAYVEAGNFFGAREPLERAIELNQTFCAPRLARATLYDIQGDLNGIEADLVACLEAEANTKAARALVVAQTAASQLKRAEQSVARYRDVLGNQAYVLLAEIALRSGRASDALAALSETNLPAPVKLMSEAYAHLLNEDFSVALQKMNTVAPHYAGNPTVSSFVQGLEILNSEGEMRSRLPDRPMDALFGALAASDTSQQQRLWANSEDFVPGYLIAGLALETPIALQQPAVRSSLVRGLLFLERGMNGPAAESLTTAVENIDAGESPSAAAFLHYLRAAALLRSADQLAGERALAQSLNAAPEFVSAHFFLGEILSRRARFEEALVAFETTFELMPTAAHAIRFGAAAEVVGATNSAIRAYRFLIEELPSSHIGYNQLAWVLVSSGGDLQEAELLARKALELAPDDGPSLDTLGWILFQIGDVEAALPYLRKAHEIGGPSGPLIAHHLAQAETKAGDPQRAKELYEFILSFGPDAFVISKEAQEFRDALF